MERRELSNTTFGELANNLIVITGGARSGKSLFAESLAASRQLDVYYIATMQEMASDTEASERIRRHRARRAHTWKTIEMPYNAQQAIEQLPDREAVCIFDCLSLYISNILLQEDAKHSEIQEIELAVERALSELLQAIRLRSEISFLIVTNEVGWGVVPENGLARTYRDLLGIANQTMAQVASEVWLSCSGIQIPLKPRFISTARE